jgi:DNA processing protein
VSGANRVTSTEAEQAAAVALTQLSGITPSRLVGLLDVFGAVGAWERVCAGAPELLSAMAGNRARVGSIELATWRDETRRLNPTALLERCQQTNTSVLVRGAAHYPTDLLSDPLPPGVLFARGDIGALTQPRAAIVGTRRASRLGLEMAFRLGRDCARGGIGVVSGLALGIDAAAHGGALDVATSSPIAIVGSGTDVVYPRQNRQLWDAVVERGLLLSEYPPGTRPLPERFPARNRLVAALSQVVVCVESHASGGALGTVAAAVDRGREVLAVPGPAAAAYSEGSNALLRVHAVAVGDTVDPRPEPDTVAACVLAVIGWEPRTIDWLLDHTGLGTGAVALALQRLHNDRWVSHEHGRWHRLAPPFSGGKLS